MSSNPVESHLDKIRQSLEEANKILNGRIARLVDRYETYIEALQELHQMKIPLLIRIHEEDGKTIVVLVNPHDPLDDIVHVEIDKNMPFSEIIKSLASSSMLREILLEKIEKTLEDLNYSFKQFIFDYAEMIRNAYKCVATEK